MYTMRTTQITDFQTFNEYFDSKKWRYATCNRFEVYQCGEAAHIRVYPLDRKENFLSGGIFEELQQWFPGVEFIGVSYRRKDGMSALFIVDFEK